MEQWSEINCQIHTLVWHGRWEQDRVFVTELEFPSSSPQSGMVYLSSSSASTWALHGIASCAFLASFFQVPSHGIYEKVPERLPLVSTGEKKQTSQRSRYNTRTLLKPYVRKPSSSSTKHVYYFLPHTLRNYNAKPKVSLRNSTRKFNWPWIIEVTDNAKENIRNENTPNPLCRPTLTQNSGPHAIHSPTRLLKKPHFHPKFSPWNIDYIQSDCG